MSVIGLMGIKPITYVVKIPIIAYFALGCRSPLCLGIFPTACRSSALLSLLSYFPRAKSPFDALIIYIYMMPRFFGRFHSRFAGARGMQAV